MTVLAVQIAGVAIDLRLSGPAPEVHARYGVFARRSGPAAFVLDVRPGPLAGLGRVTGRPVSAGARWQLAGAEHLGWMDPSDRTGEVVADPSLLVLDGLVRAALGHDVLARGGILVHAAAVRVDGRAHLCPGRSGAGKSTLAGRAGHALSDELVAVLPCADGFAVHATPWWASQGGEAPLAGVYVLAWDGEGVETLPRAGLLRHLATNLVLPFDGDAERARALGAAARIAAAAKFARLSFRRDTDVDAVLRRHAVARAA